VVLLQDQTKLPKRDINLVLTREENIAKSDLIIVAGDNLFSEPLVERTEVDHRSLMRAAADLYAEDRARRL